MANYKRPKTKRRVRCTICTPHRWRGNGKGRHAPVIAESRERQKISREVRGEVNG